MPDSDITAAADGHQSAGHGVGHCPACGRPAAASRPQCLYCGTLLREPADRTEPVSLPPGPDLSTPGCTLFAVNGDAERTAAYLSIEADAIRNLLSEPMMPIARTGSVPEAQQLSRELEEIGTSCVIVHDSDLHLAKVNIRIAGIELDGGRAIITAFNTRIATAFDAADFVLIVEGTISETRTDSISKGLRRSGKSLGETVTSVDGPVLDLYTSSSPTGFRVVPSGFDFSFLGSRKRLTAAENWQALIDVLADRFPAVHVDQSYNRLRRSLDFVWPPETRASTTGKVVSGFGRRDFGSYAEVSNLAQFNIYSRSRKHLL